jgi:2-oxoglutarate/2-oxoacid ferredoxin oxidoreductase subunit beta
MSVTAEQTQEPKKLTKKDFVSDQTVRWCPGCGDYAILTAMQNTMADLGKTRENTVFISGIGCSSRFPYYMNTFGFHTIHGRAPAVATGTKVANPDLDVWLVSGDGDSFSIGGNHFIHAVRRNIGIKYLIFNNEIYGLTKGQYSPTSSVGTVAKSTPYGSLDRRFYPGSLAIGAEATFFARVADTSPKDMKALFIEANKHKGTAVIEVLQNCVIFNDGTFKDVTDREQRSEHQLILKHGEPMLFGKDNDKGIMLEGAELKVVKLGENGITEKDILVHDTQNMSPNISFMLSRMKFPEFPVPIGIFRSIQLPTYEEDVALQVSQVQKKKPNPSLKDLLHDGETWEVK